MKIYDISGNEIHGKEVVFEYTLHADNNPLESVISKALDKPYQYNKMGLIYNKRVG